MQTLSADHENIRTTLSRLVRLRWLLLSGMLAAIAAVPAWLDVPLPALPMCLVVALLAAFNGLTAYRLRADAAPTPESLAFQVAVDLVALGVLLFLSGGAANPLVSLLLLPVAAAALMLPATWAAASAGFAIALYSLLAAWSVPLQVGDAQRATRLHLAGMWLSFVISAALVSWLIVRMTASIRQRDAALAAAREQALRDERVVALGALAAGAAHELGTPLATMAVIAGELGHRQDVPADVREDLDLLRQQVVACKSIVTGLADRAGAARLEGARAVAADDWFADVVAAWRTTRPRAVCEAQVAGAGNAPTIVVDATLEQALGNLLDNAATASPGGIEAILDWNKDTLGIEVRDRGPGFPEGVLAAAGRQPLSSATGGSGIGLLLAHAAVERLGGKLNLSNRRDGGCARMELRLATIATEGGRA